MDKHCLFTYLALIWQEGNIYFLKGLDVLGNMLLTQLIEQFIWTCCKVQKKISENEKHIL